MRLGVWFHCSIAAFLVSSMSFLSFVILSPGQLEDHGRLAGHSRVIKCLQVSLTSTKPRSKYLRYLQQPLAMGVSREKPVDFFIARHDSDDRRPDGGKQGNSSRVLSIQRLSFDHECISYTWRPASRMTPSPKAELLLSRVHTGVGGPPAFSFSTGCRSCPFRLGCG